MLENQFILQQYLEDLTICDDLIEYFNNSTDKRKGICGQKGSLVVDENIKNSTDVLLGDGVIADKYFTALSKVIELYKEKYKFCDEYAPWGVVQMPNIQHYDKGGAFKAWHTERTRGNGIDSSRHLVFMTYLNDIDDAGETEFFYQNIKIKPRKGLTVIWGADWTFTHRGIPSPTQEKYIITGWLNFLE